MQNKEKRAPRKNTFPFLVSGPVPGFLNEIHEWTSAVNEAQALKQVAKRLEKKHPDMVIYLGDCTLTKGKRPPSLTLRQGWGVTQ